MQHFERAFSISTTANAVHLQRIRHVTQHRAPKKHRVLEYHALTAAVLSPRITVPNNRPRTRCEQAVTQSKQQTLSGSVRPNDKSSYSRFEAQTHTRQ